MTIAGHREVDFMNEIRVVADNQPDDGELITVTVLMRNPIPGTLGIKGELWYPLDQHLNRDKQGYIDVPGSRSVIVLPGNNPRHLVTIRYRSIVSMKPCMFTCLTPEPPIYAITKSIEA